MGGEFLLLKQNPESITLAWVSGMIVKLVGENIPVP